jgi:SMODS-associating 4TM effector domain
LNAGKRADPEIVREQADEFEKTQTKSTPLTDWYPRIVGELPLQVARIVCQRSNCWWDSKQRRRYAAWVIGGVVITSVCILGLGFIGGITVEKLLLAIFLPLSPALLLGIRQFSDQSEAAESVG